VALERREPETHDTAALDLCRHALWMDHCAAIGYTDIIDDIELTGLDIELDLHETRYECRGLSTDREIILGDADKSGTRQRRCGAARHRIDVIGQFMTIVLAAEFDCALCGRRISQILRWIRFEEDRLVTDVIVVGRAAKVRCGNLLEFRDRVHGCHIVRAAHRERRVAAELADVPRQMTPAITALDHAAVPITFEHLGRNPRRAGM